MAVTPEISGNRGADMRARGFSLVEMVLVICTISILTAIGTLKFNEYSRRFRSEAQTRFIYDTLLKARADAVYQRRGTRVKLYTNRFEIYSSACEHCDTAAPVRREQLGYRVIKNDSINCDDGFVIDFDARGVTSSNCSICVGDQESSGGVDSIIVSTTRLRIGKRDKGNDCNAGNIIVR